MKSLGKLVFLFVLAVLVMFGPVVRVEADNSEVDYYAHWQDGGQAGEEAPVVVVEESNEFPTWGIALALFSVLTIITAAVERRVSLREILQRLDNDQESKRQVQDALSKSASPDTVKVIHDLALGVRQGGQFLSDQFAYPGVPKSLADQLRRWADIAEAGGDYVADVSEPLSTSVKEQANPAPKFPNG